MILHIFICGEDFLVARWAYLFCPNFVLKLVLFILLANAGNVDSQYFKVKVLDHSISTVRQQRVNRQNIKYDPYKFNFTP